MKRIVGTLLAVSLLLALCACTENKIVEDLTPPKNTQAETIARETTTLPKAETTVPPEVLKTENIIINGIYVDDSYQDKQSSALKMVYMFYTLIVEKNRTISKQNFLILALIALILIISAGAALLIGHLRHQAPVTVSPAPVITINGKYTYLALDSVSYHEPQIVTRNIKMLPTNEIAKLPGNRKTEHFSICCEEAFDEIRAFYFYLGEDNLYYDATLDNFFEKGESWFTTDIAIPVELNALSFSVPASDYKILIRIELVREEKTFIYFSLYE